MDSPNLDALLEELTAAHDEIRLKVRGLTDLTKIGDSLAPETMGAVQAQLIEHQQRDGLIVAAIDALKALTDDGYPEDLVVSVNQASWDDLQEQAADFTASFSQFSEP